MSVNAGLLLIVGVLFFAACTSKKKAVNITQSTTETEVNKITTDTTNQITKEEEVTEKEQQTVETEDEVIEITGPVTITPDGTIKTTSSETTIKKTRKKKRIHDLKTKIVKTDSTAKSEKRIVQADSTSQQKIKRKDVTVEKEPKVLAWLGVLALVLVLVYLIGRFILPRIL